MKSKEFTIERGYSTYHAQLHTSNPKLLNEFPFFKEKFVYKFICQFWEKLLHKHCSLTREGKDECAFLFLDGF